MEKDFSKYYKITDKEFWKNYWFYYRVHTIVGIIVILLVISTIVGIVTRVNPDIILLHIGTGVFPEDQNVQVESYLSEKTPDLNEDGRQVADFQTLLFNEEVDPQMAFASMTKADLEFAGGEFTIALVDESIAQRYINMEVFQDLSNYVEKLGLKPEQLQYSEDGSQPLLVNIMDTRLVQESGYQGPDLYMGLRIIPRDMEKDEEMMARAEASTQLFEELITDKP